MAAKKKAVIKRSGAKGALSAAQVVALLQNKVDIPSGFERRAFALWLEGDESIEKPLRTFVAKHAYGMASVVAAIDDLVADKNFDDAARVARFAIGVTKTNHGQLLLAALRLLAAAPRGLIEDDERIAWRDAMLTVDKPYQLQLAVEALRKMKDDDGVVAAARALAAGGKRAKDKRHWSGAAAELIADKKLIARLPRDVGDALGALGALATGD